MVAQPAGGAALRVVEQVVLEVGISLHHPDVAQHLVQHARRAAGAALAAQLALLNGFVVQNGNGSNFSMGGADTPDQPITTELEGAE